MGSHGRGDAARCKRLGVRVKQPNTGSGSVVHKHQWASVHDEYLILPSKWWAWVRSVPGVDLQERSANQPRVSPNAPLVVDVQERKWRSDPTQLTLPNMR